MKQKTISKAFAEIWHAIRLRKEYYDKLSKKNDSERVLTLKLEYEELDDHINWLLARFEKEENKPT